MKSESQMRPVSGEPAPKKTAPSTAPVLPPAIEQCIGRTVKKTRLWSKEQRDVAVELGSHFREGLASGRSADDLLRDFGPEDQIARLIRRSKRRQRPISWHFLHRSVQAALVVIALFAALYLVSAVRFFTASPRIAVNYIERMATPIAAIPESDRAWPHYRAAMLGILQTPGAPADGILPHPVGIEPDDAETLAMWEATVAWLPRIEAEIAGLREASRYPAMGLVPSYLPAEEDRPLYPDTDFDAPDSDFAPLLDGSLLGMLLPHVSLMRGNARLLAAHAWVNAERATASPGDDRGINGGIATDRAAVAAGPGAMSPGEMAAADLIALVRMAEHTTEMPVLINQLVGMAVYAMALEQTTLILEHFPEALPREELKNLAHAIAAYRHGDLTLDMRWERFFMDDLTQRMYSDNGRGGGHLSAKGMQALPTVAGLQGGGGAVIDGAVGMVLGPALLLTAYDRADVTRRHQARFDRVDSLMLKPTWQRTTADSIADDDPDTLQNLIRLDIGAMIDPALDRVTVLPWKTMMLRDACLTAIALELARRDRGQWPERLDTLVPTYLPRVPLDMYTGQPLGYRVTEDGRPLLYSVGVDHDDDEGVEPVDGPGGAMSYRVTDWQPRNLIESSQVAADETAADGAEGTAGAGDIVLRGIPDGDWELFRPAVDRAAAVRE